MPDRARRVADAARRVDGHGRMVGLAQAVRRRLPGDSAFGDPLSLGGSEPVALVAQRLPTSQRPSALRELGMGALQVWQAVGQAQGRGRGSRELTILFTDLVDFSKWSLKAGDEHTVELLRQVGQAVEPVVRCHRGRVVKRLGDGLMAVFPDVPGAVEAAREAVEAVEALEVAGHRPQLRAGLHTGRPRELGGDLFGVDVTIAARVAGASKGGEVLLTDAVCERLGETPYDLKRRWRFKAKGTPRDLTVYALVA